MHDKYFKSLFAYLLLVFIISAIIIIGYLNFSLVNPNQKNLHNSNDREISSSTNSTNFTKFIIISITLPVISEKSSNSYSYSGIKYPFYAYLNSLKWLEFNVQPIILCVHHKNLNPQSEKFLKFIQTSFTRAGIIFREFAHQIQRYLH